MAETLERIDIQHIRQVVRKGFMADEEALALYETAKRVAKLGPCLEIGGYCGLSTSFLGLGCRESDGILYSIDHHRGSEEQQPGQPYFDAELVNPRTGCIDTLPHFLKTVQALALEKTVVPIISESTVVARHWRTPLGLLFIDGGHTFTAAFNDYNCWVSHLLPGGYLIIHDIFSDIAEGGQAPRCIYRLAVGSGLFQEIRTVKSLGILKRCCPGEVSEWAPCLWEAMSAGHQTPCGR